MRFVYHNDRILRHPRVELHLLQQNAVGHYFNPRRRVGFIFEAHFVSDESGVACAELLCNEFAYGKGGDPSRLRHRDDTRFGITRFVEDDRNLRRFAAAGRALHDDHLVVRERVQNALLLFVYRKRFVIYSHVFRTRVFSMMILRAAM